MGVKQTFKVEGLKELNDALAELTKSTSKAVQRRAATESLKPIEDAARAKAPRRTGKLEIGIATKPVKAQRASRTRYVSSSVVEVATGPTTASQKGGNPAWQEFGTVDMPAHPYMRPAADAHAEEVIGLVREKLAEQIAKTTARLAARAGKSGG